jgi:hypothetical protein
VASRGKQGHLSDVYCRTSSRAAQKNSWLMAAILLVGVVSVGGLFTMHFYVKPSPPIRRGFRILGFHGLVKKRQCVATPV